MTYAWPPLAETLTWLKLQPETPQAAAAELACKAAAGYVEEHRADLLDATVAPAVYRPTDSVGFGTVLLAARLFARNGSPAGLASYAEFGPAQVLRIDPDIERQLGLGRNAAPRIG